MFFLSPNIIVKAVMGMLFLGLKLNTYVMALLKWLAQNLPHCWLELFDTVSDNGEQRHWLGKSVDGSHLDNLGVTFAEIRDGVPTVHEIHLLK